MTGNVTTCREDAQSPGVLLALASLRRDEALWPRHGLHPARVREMAGLYQEGGPHALPPLLVGAIDGHRYLIDGWQRCAAAEGLGWLSLRAVIKPLPRVEDVYLEALAACAAGDQPLALTQIEKRAAVDRLLQLVPSYSDRCIARLAGVSHPFVSDRRGRLERGGEEYRGRREPATASRREAARILTAVARLDRLQGSLQHLTAGEPLDPAAALREAAGSRGPAGEPLLQKLARWAASASTF